MKGLHICAAEAGVALALMLTAQVQQGRLEEYKARYERESDPVHKAKLVEKLGDYQFNEIRQQVQAGQFDQGLRTLEAYRDECSSTHQSLKATHADAEKKPSGFKELEFSVRENLNRLREVLVDVPKDQQARFLDIRAELEELNRQLIVELFPHQPKPGSKDSQKP
jgi:hypothetical protein